ncbi:MAG: hypothetical protein L3J36_07355 [Rhodobacteraceae bacterium]|nr:hypothetical protein [Paracoccaceae bacterium]
MIQETIKVQFVLGRDEFLQAGQAQKPPRPTMKQYALTGLAIAVGAGVLVVFLVRALGVMLQTESVLVGGLMVFEYWRQSHRRQVKHAVSIARLQQWKSAS